MVSPPAPENKRSEQVIKIHECFTRGEPPEGFAGPFHSFGLGSSSFTVLGEEKCRIFEDELDALLSSDRELGSKLSERLFKKYIIELMQTSVPRGFAPTISECDELWAQLKSLPALDYQVIRPVHGVTLGSHQNTLTLGPFRFFDMSANINEVITKDHIGRPSWLNKDSYGVYVECRVKACDNDKALELADLQFGRLEMILTAVIGLQYEHYRVRILSVPMGSSLRHAMFTEQTVVSGSQHMNPVQVLDLSKPMFVESNSALARLLSIPGIAGTSLENRIMRAVEWIGESLLDGSTSGAFIKGSTALEVLLREDQAGPITPSIMAQLAECTAYVLAESSDAGIWTEGEIKRLYGIRSKIVHSGTDEVDVHDYHQLAHIVLSLIWKLLGDSRYRDLTSVGEVHRFLKKQKYSVCKPS